MNKFLDTVCGAAEDIGSSFTHPDDDFGGDDADRDAARGCLPRLHLRLR